MMHQQPQESIWGTINSCVEIALNIYMIIAVDEKGQEHTGIMAHKDTEGNTLSEKTAGLAKRDGDWFCFDENVKDSAMYEVLEKRLGTCKKLEAAVMQEMEEIKKGSQVLLPQYFGNCPLPEAGSVEADGEIRNGIYFVQDGAEKQLAVHESVSRHYLTPMALEFGRQDGEYHYFSLDHCAVPIHELRTVFEEVEGLIVSADSLYATLHGQFSEYVKQFNQLVQEAEQIPAVEAPQHLFLPVQLEQSEAGTEVEVHPEEYGEQVDFGIEI